MNTQRWVDGGLAVTSIVAALVFRQIAEAVWDYFRLPLNAEWVVTWPVLIAVGLAIFLFFVLRRHPKVNRFLTEVVLELSKVTWPPRKETLFSGVIVVVMVGIASVILFLFDSVWGTVMQKFFRVSGA